MVGVQTAALAGLRIFDLSHKIMGMNTGKILGDMGAEVILVEPPGGCSAREIPPFAGGKPHPEKSLHFIHYNRNKKSLSLDLQRPEGVAIFKKLIRKADVVIEDFPTGHMQSLGLEASALRKFNEKIIITSVTGFGRKGPWKAFEASDLVENAVGGLQYLTGSKERPPVRPGGNQAEQITSLHAVVGTLGAVLFRDFDGGAGQAVDISAMECISSILEFAFEAYTYQGIVPERLGNRHPSVWPNGIFPCKDGNIFLVTGSDHQATACFKFLKDEEILEDPRLLARADRKAMADEWEPRLLNRLAEWNKWDFFKEAQAAGVPNSVVCDVKDVCEDPHIRHREVLQEFYQPGAGYIQDTVGSVKFMKTPMQVHRPAPRVGEHTTEILRDIGFSEPEINRLMQERITE
jgi:CoA:oxalate CoA-transferase